MAENVQLFWWSSWTIAKAYERVQEKKLNERLKPVLQDYDSVTFCTKLVLQDYDSVTFCTKLVLQGYDSVTFCTKLFPCCMRC